MRSTSVPPSLHCVRNGKTRHFAREVRPRWLTGVVSSATVAQIPTMDLEGASVLVPGTNAPLGETLVLCHDRPSGLTGAIAVDDTTLGPGLGGVRWMPYPSFGAAVEEACRLSRGMTDR